MYAPVSTSAMAEAGDHLIGYAAPAEGPLPCLLRLMADDVPVAAARATRFSPDAQAKSVRLGWCGMRLPGLAMATAVGSDLKVRCGVTDRVLWRRKAHAPVPRPPIQDRPLTVFEILALSRAEDESPSLDEIRPVIQHHLKRFGADSFVNATYETFLGRSAEADVFEIYRGRRDSDVIESCLGTVLGSAEYTARSLKSLPGPFSFSFKYDLSALDHR